MSDLINRVTDNYYKKSNYEKIYFIATMLAKAVNKIVRSSFNVRLSVRQFSLQLIID